jgi:hypothetical protein
MPGLYFKTIILKHLCACPKTGAGFPTSYVVVSDVMLGRELIVRCVDIGGIDDHHYLNFLFIIIRTHIAFNVQLLALVVLLHQL